MSSTVLMINLNFTSIFLARIGDILCFLGFLVGLDLWGSLDRTRKGIVWFLGLSTVCGIAEAMLRGAGLFNFWVQWIWFAALLLALAPSVLCGLRRHIKRVGWVILCVALAAWGWTMGIPLGLAILRSIRFAGYFSPVYKPVPVAVFFFVGLALIGALQLLQCLDLRGNLMKDRAFVLGLSCMSIGVFDAVAISVPTDIVWVTRNGIWCGVYILLAYALVLKGRTRGGLRDGFPVSGDIRARMERGKQILKQQRGPRWIDLLWHHPKNAE